MNVIELYKIHINPDANWGEIHNFMRKFEIGELYVPHPNKEIRKLINEETRIKTEVAKQHIIENSKIKI